MSFSIRELSVNIDGALHGRPEPGVQSCDTTEPSDAAKPSCDDRSTRRPPPGRPGQPRPPKHKPRDVPPPERDSGCDMNSNQETSDQADGWNAADLADLRAQLDATLGDDPAR